MSGLAGSKIISTKTTKPQQRHEISDGHRISATGQGSGSMAPTWAFERLLDAGSMNSLLDESERRAQCGSKRASDLKMELKDNMKVLMSTVLKRYTKYLTQAFQFSIQSELKQVSKQQLVLMKIFQNSISQTLTMMHRPEHFNPSVITDDPDQFSKKGNQFSINTRKLNDLRFQLANASQDITTLKTQNEKLKDQVNRLTTQLKYPEGQTDAQRLSLSWSEARREKAALDARIKQMDVLEYIEFCKENTDSYEVDFKIMSKLVKKQQRDLEMKIEDSDEALKEFKVKFSKVGSAKYELAKRLAESQDRNAQILQHMKHMELKFDKQQIEFEQQLNDKIKAELTKFKSLGQGLNSAIENMQIQTTCQCCLSQLQNPVLLTCCGHTVCSKCVRSAADDTQVACGECEQKQNKDHLIKLPILQNIVNRLESVQYHAQKIQKRSV